MPLALRCWIITSLKPEILWLFSGHRSETSLKNYRKKPSKTRIHEMSTALTSALISENDSSINNNHDSNVSEIVEVQSESIEIDGEIFLHDEQFEELMKANNPQELVLMQVNSQKEVANKPQVPVVNNIMKRKISLRSV